MNQTLLLDREFGRNCRFQQLQYVNKQIRSIDISVLSEFIPYHNGPLNCLDFEQSENRYLISGGADGLILVYDTFQSQFENTSPTKKNIIKYEPILNIKRKPLPPKQYGYNQPVRLTPMEDITKLFKGVSAVQWYPNDTGMFFTGSVDGAVEVWDTNLESVSVQFDMEHAVNAISYPTLSTSSNALLIAVATTDQKARLCDIRIKKSTHCLTGHRESILCIKWSPTSPNLLVTGSRDKTIRLWDIRRGDSYLMALDQYHSSLISQDPVAEQQQNQSGSTNFDDKGLPKFRQKQYSGVKKTSKEYQFLMRRNENENGSPNSAIRKDVPLAHNGYITSLAWMPDGRHLVSTGNDSKIHLWDMLKGVNTFVDFPKAHNANKTPNQIALSPVDGKFIFHPNGKAINVYSTLTGELVKYLKGHFEKVNCCLFHPTEQILYSGSNDKMLLAWDTSKEDQVEENQYQNNYQQLKKSLIEAKLIIPDTEEIEPEELINKNNNNNSRSNNINNLQSTNSSTTLPDEDRWDDD
ncbi:WD40 repeat-containing protein [Tieghemostelium lacteum]|uniref:WD40 repeat-containing protein n=1 Tax=Tieghemostelium lacteum TaxID=361077 RepID=A0A151Z6D9_TIELA|nr:WD40 repeat-containing protein [Tieghemostelium lacteum]|eukprot:KYQ89497.1 WD40 repeat-containing protein [Tieghemostelium lacteum]